MSKEIELRVCEIIAEHMGVRLGDVGPETRFTDDLGADSLDGIEVALKVEDEFDIDILDTFVPITVGDVVKAVEDAVNGKAKPDAV